jgi:putative phosphoesterase
VINFDAVAATSAAAREPAVARLTARSAAFLSDIHANDAAFGAVLAELRADPPDVVVLNGDITWGTFPVETVALIDKLRAMVGQVVLIRGNGDRAVLELLDGHRAPDGPRDRWMPQRHGPREIATLRQVVFQVDVDVAGFGVIRACHGSPRADIELITPQTPLDRLAAATDGVEADVLLTGHTHLQFDRPVDGLRIKRSVNPGSVGLPYGEPAAAACWLRVDGDGLHFRRSEYDVESWIDRMRATDDPRADVIAELLREPPSVHEITAHAESVAFSD